MMKSSGAHKEPAMVLAHFNKHELDVLDRMQGKKLIDPKTGVRHYRDLGDTFKNPHVKNLSLLRARSHHALGGRANINKMKKEGRHGDNEMAYIPRHMADHLDEMMGGKSVNPHTHHREYWGLKDMFQSVFSPFSNMITNNIKPLTQFGGAIKPYVNALTGASDAEPEQEEGPQQNGNPAPQQQQQQQAQPQNQQNQQQQPQQNQAPNNMQSQQNGSGLQQSMQQNGVISPPMGGLPNINKPNSQQQLQPGIAS